MIYSRRNSFKIFFKSRNSHCKRRLSDYNFL